MFSGSSHTENYKQGSLVANLSATLLILLLLILCSFPRIVFAEQYIIQIKKSGVAQTGIEIYGNRGFNDIPGRYTGTNGQWVFNSTDLEDSSILPTVTFVDPAGVLRFEPAELAVNTTNCPGRVCDISAINDGNPQTIIQWSYTNTQGQPMAGIPVQVPGAYVSCAKETDSNGYVFFAVRKTSSACNDRNGVLGDNLYSVFPHSPKGKTCTFSTTLRNKFRTCADSVRMGNATANCTDVESLAGAPGAGSTYTFIVQTDTGSAVSGVEFSGNNGITNLSSRTTDGNGRWSFTTQSINAAENTEFTVIPTGNYQFSPRSMTVSPNSCPLNICKVWAAERDGEKQGVLNWSIKESDGTTPFIGARVQRGDAQSCKSDAPQYSDTRGSAFFPTAIQEICDYQVNTKPYASFLVNSPDCNFNHQSSTPFQFCATQYNHQTSALASCGGLERDNFMVKGTVRDGDGFPLYGAQVWIDNNVVGSTNSNGQYSVLVAQGSTPVIQVKKSPFVFDPVTVAFHSIAHHFFDIDFDAVYPFPSISPGDPNLGDCSAKLNYEISGKVLNSNGAPLAGVVIANNFVERAVSDSNGNYQITVSPFSDNWVTAEQEDLYFDPAAIGLIDLHCDTNNVNFKSIPVPSFYLGGRLRDRYGRAIPNATAQIRTTFRGDAKTQTIATDADGEYLFSVPQGGVYEILMQPIERPNSSTYIYPITTVGEENYSGTVANDHLALDWTLADGDDVFPTPTATPTATSTPTFTATNTPTKTATATATFTPSNTPTITATFTPSKTPTNTPTFTATATSTRTGIPTITSTATKTFTPSATATATKTETPTSTATITNTATVTHTATNTFTPTITFTPSRTSTPTRTATPTMTATNTATFTATATPSNTATPTSTATATATETPAPKVHILPICLHPNGYFKWYISNVGVVPLTDLTWKNLDYQASGTIQDLPVHSDIEIHVTKNNNSNAIAIYSGMSMIGAPTFPITDSTGAYIPCAITPVPTATITRTPIPTSTPTRDPNSKVTICHVPGPAEPKQEGLNGNELTLTWQQAKEKHLDIHPDDHEKNYEGPCRIPTQLPTATPTRTGTFTPTQTATSTPLPTETPTATPTPHSYLTGTLFNERGKALTEAQKVALTDVINDIRVRISIGNTTFLVPLDDQTMSWTAEVTRGKTYSVRLMLTGEAQKRYSLVSRPIVYQAVVSDGDYNSSLGSYVQGGIHYALSPKATGSKASSVSATQRVIKIKAKDTYTSEARSRAATVSQKRGAE